MLNPRQSDLERLSNLFPLLQCVCPVFVIVQRFSWDLGHGDEHDIASWNVLHISQIDIVAPHRGSEASCVLVVPRRKWWRAKVSFVVCVLNSSASVWSEGHIRSQI